jgi:STE24 endopeptidase
MTAVSGPLPIDAGRQRLAEEYARTRLRLRALALVLSVAALCALGPIGIAPWLRDVVGRAVGVWPLRVLLFFLTIGAAWAIVQAPMTYFAAFVLPHRYGLSNQTLHQWLADVAKGGAIGIILGSIAVETLYGFLRAAPDTWWIWTGIAYGFFTVALSALAPVILLPLFFRLEPLGDEDLSRRVLELAGKAGARVREVCRVNLSSKTPAANAAVIGLGRTRKIVLGDSLTDSFPLDEVEVIVAHELGHHVHGDVARGLGLDFVFGLAGFLVANLVLHVAKGRWHFEAIWDLGLFPVLALVLGLWGALTGVLSRGYSRRMESAADAYSLALTGQGEAFVNSEIRLTNQNLAWLCPPVWVERLFYTHPAPWRRIAMGQSYLADRPSQR